MKKVLLSILFAGVSTFTFAQKSEISEAKKSFNVFQLVSQSKVTLDKKLQPLNEGIKHTDNAIANEKSKIIAEAWSIRALLASTIALTDTADLQNSEKNIKLAEEAIAKAKELDTKGAQKEDLKNAQLNIEIAVKNAGIIAYNKRDYKAAYRNFVRATEISPTDTSMYLNAGIAARTIEQYPDMIKQYKKVIELNSPQSKDLYFEIINVTLGKLKDTTAALAIIKEAEAKFPNVKEFIQHETQIYIDRGDAAKSEEMIKKLVVQEPNNSTYQLLLGNVYFQQALNLQIKRNKIDPKKVKEFTAVTTQMNALLEKSFPYYKKSFELDSKSISALEALKQISAFKNDTKNYEMYKKLLEEANKK